MRNAISIRRLVTIAGGLVVGVAACTPIKPTPPTHLPDPPPPAKAELTIDPVQAELSDTESSQGESQVFTITNIGDQDSGPLEVGLGAAQVTISADPCSGAGDTTISAGGCPFTVLADTCSDVVLHGGDSCTVEVRYSAGEVGGGTDEGELQVSAVPGGEVTAELSGEFIV